MQIIIRDFADTFTSKFSTWLMLKHTFCYSSRCYFSARLSHRSTISLEPDSHRWPCTQAPDTKGEQLERFEETLSRGYHRTKDTFEFPVFFFSSSSPSIEHTRAHTRPPGLVLQETVPYQGHRVVPPSVPGLFEALLPEISFHVVGVTYMPQKISGIDADSKLPPATTSAKGTCLLSSRASPGTLMLRGWHSQRFRNNFLRRERNLSYNA